MLVDLDPQGNATIACGIPRDAATQTIYDCLVDGIHILKLEQPSSIEGLRVVPATLDMAGCEVKLSQAQTRESVLKGICEPALARYDVVIFDCPPSLGLVTVNALVASHYVLVPTQCEYLALEGLSALVSTIKLVKSSANRSLEIGGIVLTMADFRSSLAKEVAAEIRKFFGSLVFESVVPRNVRLAESPSFGKPICLYDPYSTGALAYQLLANEVIERLLVRRSSGESPPPQEQTRSVRQQPVEPAAAPTQEAA